MTRDLREALQVIYVIIHRCAHLGSILILRNMERQYSYSTPKLITRSHYCKEALQN